MRNILFAILAALFALTAQGQEAVPPAIASAYESVLSMLQTAKSPEDIHRMVETTDAQDWMSVSPTGEKTSRSEAEKQLEGLLSIPSGQRPVPLQKVIYTSEQGHTCFRGVLGLSDHRHGGYWLTCPRFVDSDSGWMAKSDA